MTVNDTNTIKNSKIVDRMKDGRSITAHTTVLHLNGKPYHAIAHYTLEGCGLKFPSQYMARVHATMVKQVSA